MRQFLLLCMFLGMGTFLQAQVQCNGNSSAKSSCCASKSAATAEATTTVTPTTLTAADRAASLDPTIESRENPSTGETIYLQKATCEVSGSVSYRMVNFDETSGTFITPEIIASNDRATQGDETTPAKPACCANKAASSGCANKATSSGCAGKATTDDEKPQRPRRSSNVKLVNY